MKQSNLPCIWKKEVKMSATGHVLEEKQLQVFGKSMAEVKKIFDNEWDKK